MRNILLILGVVFLFSCTSNQSDNMKISKDEMIKIAKECDDQFRIGVQKHDSAYIADMYSDSALYIIPDREILKGKAEIGKEWAEFLRLKERPVDLILNIEDVRGNREIIYETGQGYTLLADSAKWPFNYVNIWRLQNDGTYKLEIDIYN